MVPVPRVTIAVPFPPFRDADDMRSAILFDYTVKEPHEQGVVWLEPISRPIATPCVQQRPHDEGHSEPRLRQERNTSAH